MGIKALRAEFVPAHWLRPGDAPPVRCWLRCSLRGAPPGLFGYCCRLEPALTRAVPPAGRPRRPASFVGGALLRASGLLARFARVGWWFAGRRAVSVPEARLHSRRPGRGLSRPASARRPGWPRFVGAPLRLPGASPCPRRGPRTACSVGAGLPWSGSPCLLRMTLSGRFRLRRIAHWATASLDPPFRGRAASGLAAGSRSFRSCGRRPVCHAPAGAPPVEA